jgi:hypothetical protein
MSDIVVNEMNNPSNDPEFGGRTNNLMSNDIDMSRMISVIKNRLISLVATAIKGRMLARTSKANQFTGRSANNNPSI